jgi:hypothetical protein
MKKKLLIAGSAIAGLLVVSILGLVSFLDANQFRPQLEQTMGGARPQGHHRQHQGRAALGRRRGGRSVHCGRPGVQRRAVCDGQVGDGPREFRLAVANPTGLRLQQVTALADACGTDLWPRRGPVLTITVHKGSPQAIRCGLMRELKVEG